MFLLGRQWDLLYLLQSNCCAVVLGEELIALQYLCQWQHLRRTHMCPCDDLVAVVEAQLLWQHTSEWDGGIVPSQLWIMVQVTGFCLVPWIGTTFGTSLGRRPESCFLTVCVGIPPSDSLTRECLFHMSLTLSSSIYIHEVTSYWNILFSCSDSVRDTSHQV